jgi:hypothetical protein
MSFSCINLLNKHNEENMKKLILIVASLLFANSAMSACKVGDYEFSLNITDKTSLEAYANEEAPLVEGDYGLVVNTKTGESYKFDLGFFYDDGAGNFGIEAISSQDATFLSIDHDHETWHYGLTGEFSLPTGEFIDLEEVEDCSYDKLF